VAKPEWGVKRACLSCGCGFYDLRKSPIICPKCEAKFEPEATLRARRVQRPAAEKKPKVEPAPLPEVEAEAPSVIADIAVVEDATEDEPVVDDAAEDEPVIEDTSELGGDDDVVPIVAADDEDDK